MVGGTPIVIDLIKRGRQFRFLCKECLATVDEGFFCGSNRGFADRIPKHIPLQQQPEGSKRRQYESNETCSSWPDHSSRPWRSPRSSSAIDTRDRADLKHPCRSDLRPLGCRVVAMGVRGSRREESNLGYNGRVLCRATGRRSMVSRRLILFRPSRPCLSSSGWKVAALPPD